MDGAEGAENTLTMTQTYTWEFQCKYELQRYPFDAQVNSVTIIKVRILFQPQECKIEMTVEKLANTTVRLLAKEVRYCHNQVCRCRRILEYAGHTFSAPLMIKIMKMIINCDDNNGSSRIPFFLLSHKDPS